MISCLLACWPWARWSEFTVSSLLLGWSVPNLSERRHRRHTLCTTVPSLSPFTRTTEFLQVARKVAHLSDNSVFTLTFRLWAKVRLIVLLHTHRTFSLFYYTQIAIFQAHYVQLRFSWCICVSQGSALAYSFPGLPWKGVHFIISAIRDLGFCVLPFAVSMIDF